MRFKRGHISTFCRGQRPRIQDPVWGDIDPNEDRVLVKQARNGTVLAVIDGVTDKFGFTHRGRKGGSYAADDAAYVIRKWLSPDMTPEALHAKIFRRWTWRRKHMPDIPEQEPTRAVMLIYHPWRHELWSLGDCLYGWETHDGTWVPCRDRLPEASPDAVERRHAMRNLLMTKEFEVTASSMTLRQILDNPTAPEWFGDRLLLGRLHQTAFDKMQEIRRARKVPLPGMMTEQDWAAFKVIPVPYGIRKLVLWTDGILKPTPTIEEGLRMIADLRYRDPLSVMDPPHGFTSAKGFVGGDGTIFRQTDDIGGIIATVD